jgi:hypothetical protein
MPDLELTIDVLPHVDEDDGLSDTPAPLRLILAHVPDWATVVGTDGIRIDIAGAPRQASGKPTRTFNLRIEASSSGSIHVAEAVKQHLPEFCPERHINEGGDFCVGYEAGDNISTDQAAIDWWKKLQLFLICQETAHGSRHWPPNAQLSHGPAGTIQLAAERIAASLGRERDYAEALHDRGPIAISLWQVISGEKRLLNGRAECICGRVGRNGHVKLRKECKRDDNPCLVLLEQARRTAEREFWNSLKGTTCCGTMETCPLQPGWKEPKSKVRQAKARKSNRAV